MGPFSLFKLETNYIIMHVETRENDIHIKVILIIIIIIIITTTTTPKILTKSAGLHPQLHV